MNDQLVNCQPHFHNQHYFKSEANSCQLSNVWFICVSQFLQNFMKQHLRKFNDGLSGNLQQFKWHEGAHSGG